MLAEHAGLTVDFLVLTGDERRRREADASARLLAARQLGPAGVQTLELRDGHLPAAASQVKDTVERLGAGDPYQVVICPSLHDAHQDHRVVAEVVWQTFRSTTIVEYEIPKYEGITEQSNLFVSLTRELCERKVEHLSRAFPSQVGRSWFDAETFWSLLRLRGVEGASPTGYAEAFICRKLRL